MIQRPPCMGVVRYLTISLSLLIIAFAFYGCGPGATLFPAKPPRGVLYFHPQIPKIQKDLILGDLNYLSNLGPLKMDPDLIRYMKLPDSNSKSLVNDIYQGIQFILPENFNLNGHIFQDQRYSYQNPGIFPTLDSGDETRINGAGGAELLANNMGSALYLQGKLNGELLYMDIEGFGNVAITSPMVGIIQIGPGLFNTRKHFQSGRGFQRPYTSHKMASGLAGTSYDPSDSNITSDSEIDNLEHLFHRNIRASVIGHERRHSNGKGKSLGMFHNICPKGHTYAGLDVCDKMRNGAYTIGAYILKALIESGPDLSESAKYSLNLFYLDALSRVLAPERTAVPARGEADPYEWDSEPEGTF